MFKFTATVEMQAAGCFSPSRRSPTGSHQELAAGQMDRKLGPLGQAPASTLHVSNLGGVRERGCVRVCGRCQHDKQSTCTPHPPPKKNFELKPEEFPSAFFFFLEGGVL